MKNISEIYKKAITESEDKDWTDTSVEDIKEEKDTKTPEEYLGMVLDKEHFDLINQKDPTAVIGALDVLSTSLGYIKGKNDSVIESFLGDNPEILNIILEYVKQELKNPKNEDRAHMWSIDLQKFTEDFYNEAVDDDNEELEPKPNIGDEIYQKRARTDLMNLLDSENLDNFKDYTKEDLFDYIAGIWPKIDKRIVDDVWEQFLS